MQLRPSVVAVMFALSAPAAWAADSDSSNSVEFIDGSNPAPTVGSPASSSMENAADDANAWKFLNGRRAAADSASGADQSASSKSSGGDDQGASADDSSGNDQTAMSEDSSESDQSAAADDEENDQVAAEDSAGGDLMAMATPASRTGSFKPATLEDFRAATQDKLVVILPSGWQGSVPQLLAALEKNADAAEVLILSQDADADANNDAEEEQ